MNDIEIFEFDYNNIQLKRSSSIKQNSNFKKIN